MLKRYWLRLSAALAALVLTVGCAGAGGDKAPSGSGGQGSSSQLEGEVVVYSGRAEFLIRPVLDEFQKKTGVKVVLKSGGASEMANQIGEERNNPQADIFIANDAGTTELLRMNGLLKPYSSEAISKIPEELRAPDGAWSAVGLRARVIMYNTGLVRESELPKSIFELADPKWRGQFAMAKSSNESLIGNISALRLVKGEAETERFLRGVIANRPGVFKSHTQVRQAVGKGEFKLGWVNHYYYHLEKAAGSPVGIAYLDQGEGEIGTPVNASAVAQVRGGKHPRAAEAFMDFVLSPEIQELFTKGEYEIPVLPGVPANEARPLDTFKRSNISLAKFGEELQRTINLIEKVGLP